MPWSGDDDDSRTASVGLQRSQANGSTNSRRGSQERSRKRQKTGDRDVRDFVPQGATFSANPLAVDSDDTSSSGSDSDSDDEGSKDSGEQLTRKSPSVPGKADEPRSTAQFNTVNDRYWRTRSASPSSADGGPSRDDNSVEEGEVNDDSSSGSGALDESDSVDSEADDSIMLNIGSRRQRTHSEGNQNGQSSAQGSQYDPESRRVIEEGLSNGKNPQMLDGTVEGTASTVSKEDCLRQFSQKYPTAPSTLVDLTRHDMETLAKFLFYDRDINDLDLELPIACTECLRQGHLAEVCPSKECVHCGAWNQHQSVFCPNWRKCQKCRQRGHDDKQCGQVFSNATSQIPCDLCGSADHTEVECDRLWKYPQKEPSAGPVLVSISCAHCTSMRHLMGDCPERRRPMTSSSWTLKPFDPDMISNLNSVVDHRTRGGSAGRGQRGLKIRGRADQRSPSPSEDDMMAGPRRPIGRNAPERPNIQIGKIGRGRGGRPGSGSDSRSAYRDRQDFPGQNTRQRSLSPNARPVGRGGDTWKPPPRPPPGPGPGPGPRGRGRGRGSTRARGGSRRGGGDDSFRPLPSAAKRAWDTYRL